MSLHALFNYILKLLCLGCQWKELPIEKDGEGRREVHRTSVWRVFRQWEADGCFDAIFEGTVLTLHQANLLDVSIIHGDGTTTAATISALAGTRRSKVTRSLLFVIGIAT